VQVLLKEKAQVQLKKNGFHCLIKGGKERKRKGFRKKGKKVFSLNRGIARGCSGDIWPEKKVRTER